MPLTLSSLFFLEPQDSDSGPGFYSPKGPGNESPSQQTPATCWDPEGDGLGGPQREELGSHPVWDWAWDLPDPSCATTSDPE